MTIDRRHLLGSLAAAAVCPTVAAVHAAAATIPARVNHKSRQSPEGWFLVRECRQQPIDRVVDFWERPFSDIAYAGYLSPEIARGAMWYDAFDQPNRQTHEAIGRSFIHPRQCASCSNSFDAVSSALRWLQDDASNSTARTAFLSLDSLSPSPMREPSWADVLSSFRSCYDHIIGHFHLPQRGLRQYRKFLNRHFGSQNERGYFQEFFADAAAQCDAVILTSSALCERVPPWPCAAHARGARTNRGGGRDWNTAQTTLFRTRKPGTVDDGRLLPGISSDDRLAIRPRSWQLRRRRSR
jgi:hypothetical protein